MSMRRRLLAVLCTGLVIAGTSPLHAGAWARGEGRSFLSFSHAISAPPGDWRQPGFDPARWTGIFFERGSTDRISLGIDAGSPGGGEAASIFFVSRSLASRRPLARRSVQAGLGFSGPTSGPDPLLQLMASFGRERETDRGPGWLAADVQVRFRPQTPAILKIDLTMGQRLGPRVRAVVQLQSGKYPGSAAYVRLHPSVVVDLRQGLAVEIGTEAGIAGSNSVGLKLGFWSEF